MLVTFCFLEEVTKYYPVYRELVERLGFRDLYLLSLCSRYFRDLVEERLSSCKDVDRRLSRFVREPKRFRLMMRDTGAVIDGDFAWSFFNGGSVGALWLTMVDGHFDSGRKMGEWTEYLKGREGYGNAVDGTLVSDGSVEVWAWTVVCGFH